ncbi:twinkleprotein, chloroplastic/mitochondrial-like [Dorcoceras hygrometricum]|uniref:Twinkleprotein, chloroplastic/mitochondrial-like n=1 Tax=Dorcoceras hygrometricum TaxID=472368 RepID=A0A2Z7BC44_9LAMI|nr:twinkleprotein, chloroplastic/mitochondrial-like [Dorcoceras hygrometricum]
MDEAEETKTDFTKLRQKMDAHGVKIDSCTPGLYDLLVCPKVVANTKKPNPAGDLHGKTNSNSPSTRESLRLEALGEELVDYFAGRMISRETLQRNKVMKVSGEKKIIAFTYRQNGLLVGCKYRTIDKKFWQDRGTEKMLYGLDDITEVDEIIIVEGEIDKLSMEEAGYYNCVSVPGGAPQTVSIKELPSAHKDISFQYLWNCKDYLDKASRIILATDGDTPGQALAEELARRLGRDRCWQVNWPEKDQLSSFKDANECTANPPPTSRLSSSQAQFIQIRRGLLFSAFSLKPISPSHQRASGYSYTPHAALPIPRPISSVNLETCDVADPKPLSMLRQKLLEIGIDGNACMPGQYNGLFCPQDRGAAMWTCFRAKCGWRGTTRAFADVRSTFARMNRIITVKQPIREITEESLQLEPLCNELVAYFAARMISKETLQRNAVMQKRTGDQIAIAFTYRRSGELVSCKYRDITKKFWQEANTEKIFYGLDDIKEASDIIIVEGEMDKLAMEEAGFKNCVSVPDGAPPKVSDKALPSEREDTKYQYLWNCREYIEKGSRIILATDADPPGQALAEELARRLGRERCWRVKWPKKNDTESFKDANEVLMYMGPDALREVIEDAELYPIKGLFNFKDYFGEIDDYYHQTLGFELGVSTGWRALNELYNVVPGELTIVTGVPNSGKSEWIDALLCNLNRNVGWKFALCSMENKVREHARKLLEKHIQKPFFDVRYGKPGERMSVEDLEQGKKWLSDSFALIRCENDCLPNIDWVLELARIAVLRHGVNGLVIDPYNELDHQRPSNQTETEYVSQMLTKVKRFAQHHSCHVWFVAHPRQLHNWIGGPPNMYDISGSAHFINKCDNGIVIHRNRDPDAGPLDTVQVCVRKVRNKVIGTIGDAFLCYNRNTGEYMDIDAASQII